MSSLLRYLLFCLIFMQAHSKTTVFLVPHSHNDAGWLLNIDECYTKYCKPTLSNIFTLLETHPQLKFCWSEVLFLSMYLEEFPLKKELIKEYIKQGRFEIVGGGWVQNDEALPDFELVSLQMQTGFDYLKKELGIDQIKIAWQLDPFGHSSLTSALFDLMGFETLVFARVDKDFSHLLELEGNYEFFWKTQGLGSNGIFTHVLNNHYSFPTFIRYAEWYDGPIRRCFDYLPANEIDMKNCAKELVKYVQYSQKKYRTQNHLLLIGDDFSFTDLEKADMYFSLLDGIVNASEKIDVKFATPSEYFEAVFKENQKFNVFEGDFYPLVSKPAEVYGLYNRVWSGYFNTKPYLKKGIQDLQKNVRIAEILSSFYLKQSVSVEELSSLTHHDAITGTCKFPVYLDYIKRLGREKKSILNSLKNSFHLIFNFSNTGTQLMVPNKIVIVVNPVNWKVSKVISLISQSKYVKILDSNGKGVRSERIEINEKTEIFFEVELETTQCKVFFVEESLSKCEMCSEDVEISEREYFGNENVEIKMNQGLIQSFSTKGKEIEVNQELLSYYTYYSGAYIFTPDDKPWKIDKLVDYKLFEGKIITLAYSLFKFRNENFTQTLQVTSAPYFELSFELNAPLDSDIFMRFKNPNPKPGWFYTFNSADIIRRHYVYEDFITKGSNYYPINGALLIDFGTTFLNIFPSFPTGAGMFSEDHFEIHLHRHPSSDDGMGLGSYVEDILPVKHLWRLSLSQFSFSNTWRSHIEHKASPSLFYIKSKDYSLSQKHSEAFEFSHKINSTYHHSVLPEDNCKYVSRMQYLDGDLRLNLMNLCENDEDLGWLELLEERKISGFKDYKRAEVEEGQVFGFRWRNNTGDNVLKHKRRKNRSKFGPFELRSFEGEYENVVEFFKLD